jgi:hypothetical protein
MIAEGEVKRTQFDSRSVTDPKRRERCRIIAGRDRGRRRSGRSARCRCRRLRWAASTHADLWMCRRASGVAVQVVLPWMYLSDGVMKRGRSREVPPDELDRVAASDERSCSVTPRDKTSTRIKRGGVDLQQEVEVAHASPDRKTSPTAPQRDSPGCEPGVEGRKRGREWVGSRFWAMPISKTTPDPFSAPTYHEQSISCMGSTALFVDMRAVRKAAPGPVWRRH